MNMRVLTPRSVQVMTDVPSEISHVVNINKWYERKDLRDYREHSKQPVLIRINMWVRFCMGLSSFNVRRHASQIEFIIFNVTRRQA